MRVPADQVRDPFGQTAVRDQRLEQGRPCPDSSLVQGVTALVKELLEVGQAALRVRREDPWDRRLP